MGFAKTRGRNIVLYVDIALQLVAFIFFFTGFSSPYWVQSWPRIYSGFKNIGLWEACFAGQVLPFDPREKAYHGCWWILAPEYHDIRRWLMPWWFVLTQVICTLVTIMIIINGILHLILWISSLRKDQAGIARRSPILVVQAATIITIINAAAMVFTVVLFGLAYYLDRNWMPYRQLNYLSWSYGCTIVGTFFLIFASIALIVYNRIVRQEYREPGSMLTPLATNVQSPPTISPTYGAPSPSSSQYPASTSAYPQGEAKYPGSTSSYPGPTSGYPGSTSAYPSQAGGYPGSTSAYPSQAGGYPGSTSGYQAGGYPGSTSTYPNQSGGYPGSTSGYPSQGGYPGQPSQGYVPPSSTSSYPAKQLYPGTSYPGESKQV